MEGVGIKESHASSRQGRKITLRRNQGRQIKAKKLQHVPQTMVSQAQMKNNEAKKEKEKKQEVGWKHAVFQ